MNPQNENGNGLTSIDETRIIIFTVLTALVILGGIWFVRRVFNPAETPTPEETTVVQAPEAWPPTPPIFTPIPAPTSTPTLGPTDTPIPTPTLTPTPSPTPSPTPTPILVGWRELGYLTSTEFTAMTSVNFEKQRSWWPDDSILLLAVGKVKAGIDMTQIEDSDVQIEGSSVKITLPHATVESVELNLDETQIVSKDGWFPADGLEVEALNQAQTQLRDWVTKQEDLMGLAEKVAESQLETFLRQLGFEEVEITFKEKDI